jgi:hypothetical protein
MERYPQLIWRKATQLELFSASKINSAFPRTDFANWSINNLCGRTVHGIICNVSCHVCMVGAYGQISCGVKGYFLNVTYNWAKMAVRNRKESQFSLSKLCVNKVKSSYHLSISALLILYLKSSYCTHRCSFRSSGTGKHHVHSVWRVILFRRLAWGLRLLPFLSFVYSVRLKFSQLIVCHILMTASDCLSHSKSPQLFEAPLLDHYLPTGVEVCTSNTFLEFISVKVLVNLFTFFSVNVGV